MSTKEKMALCIEMVGHMLAALSLMERIALELVPQEEAQAEIARIRQEKVTRNNYN